MRIAKTSIVTSIVYIISFSSVNSSNISILHLRQRELCKVEHPLLQENFVRVALSL